MRDLRHQDGIWRGVTGCEQVVRPPWRLERIDSDDDLAPAIATALDSGTHPIASERLCVRRNGIFKVQDKGICGDGLGLFEGSFVRARHIEHTAAWSALHGEAPPLTQKWKCRESSQTAGAMIRPHGGRAGIGFGRRNDYLLLIVKQS